jgi:hypothetical protein
MCRLAHDRILARPKFPSRASGTFIVLARGVDIIARDYVKVTRSVTRRREPARARSDNAGIIGSRCKSRDQARQAFFYLIESEPGRGSWPTRRSLARSSRPSYIRDEAGSLRSLGRARTSQQKASRHPGWAGVINQKSPYAILMLNLRGPESWYGIPVLGDSSFGSIRTCEAAGATIADTGFHRMQSS